MKTFGRFANSLFWKISFIFLLLLLVVGVGHLVFMTNRMEAYFELKNQRLHANLAQSVIKEVKPFLNGELTEDATDEIMHAMMAINPSIEVYLLDPEGKILNYVAPYKKVKMDQVNLGPVDEFIDSGGNGLIRGDDPRNPGLQKVFSAAPVIENETLIGYVYVVLVSEEHDAVAMPLWQEAMINLGGSSMLITLLATLFIGILVIWLITRNLSAIINAVKKFQDGDLTSRIPIHKGKGELNNLAFAFNEMADTIVGNIENLKSTENLRRELVGNVSHDLRTPLAVIHGYIETLIVKRDALSEEEKTRYLNIIIESTERLKKLVDELFELSKLEANQIQPHKEPFFINELIQDVSQKYEIIAKEKNIEIESSIPKDIPLVHADVSLIERVLQNLIDNAIKYTNPGGKISLETNADKHYVQIRITDTGKGIPEEQIPYVFQRYHIGDKRISLDKNSTGLGLAIVKKILEIHDATINLTSKLGQGSSFTFNLPSYQT